MNVEIRRLNENDQAFLWDALYHAIHLPPGADALAKEIVHDPRLSIYVDEWMKRPYDFGLVAEINALPVGSAWIRCWNDIDRGFGYVATAIPELSMSVLPEYRGRGIGTRLLRRLVADCRVRHRQLSLSVSRSNPASRLYDREGFRVLSEEDPDSLTMVLDLAGTKSGEPSDATERRNPAF